MPAGKGASSGMAVPPWYRTASTVGQSSVRARLAGRDSRSTEDESPRGLHPRAIVDHIHPLLGNRSRRTMTTSRHANRSETDRHQNVCRRLRNGVGDERVDPYEIPEQVR